MSTNDLKIKLSVDKLNENLDLIKNLEKICNQLDKKNVKINFDDNSINSFANGLDNVASKLTGIGETLNELSSNSILTKGLNYVTRSLKTGFIRDIVPEFDSIVSRLDVLNLFSSKMSIAGFDKKEANKVLDNIEQEVLGLPTTLDEIAKLTTKFTFSTGDIDKGSNVALALNAMSVMQGNEKIPPQFERWFNRLLTGGKLDTRAWDGLFTNLSTGLAIVGEQFGFSSTNISDFKNALKSGEISINQFFDGLVEAYNKNDRFRQMVEENKNTIAGAMKNIRTALNRGIANILQDIFEINADKPELAIGTFLNQIKEKINDGFKSIREVINENKGAITNVLNSLKSIKWNDIIKDVVLITAKRIKIVLDIMITLINNPLYRKIILWAPIATKAFTLMGGLLSSISQITTMLSTVKISKNITSVGVALENTAKQMRNYNFKGLLYSFGNLGLAAAFIAIIGELALVLKYVHKVQVSPDDIIKITVISSAIGAIMLGFHKFGDVIKRSVSLTKTANLIKRGAYLAGLEALTAAYIGIIKMASSVMKELHGTNWSDFGKFSALMGVVTVIMGIVEGFSLLNGVITSSVIGGAVLAVGMLFTGLQEILAAGFIKVVEMAAKCVKVVSGMSNVNYTEVREKIKGILNIFDGLESNIPSPNLVKLQNDSSRIKEVADNLVKAMPNLLSISNSPLITPSQQNGIKLRIESVINTIKTIRDSILSKIEQYQLDETEFLNFSGVLNGINEFAKSFLAVPPMISHLLQSVQSIDGPLNEWKTKGDSLKTKIGSIATTMYDLIGVIKEKFSPEDNNYPRGNFHNPYAKAGNSMELGEIIELSERIDTLSEFSGKFLTVAPGIARMIDSISSIESHLNKWNSIRTTMKVNIITFLKDIGEILGVVKSELLGLINANMFHQFNNSVNQLVGESGRSGLIGRLDYMRDVVVRLASVGENDFSGLKTSLNNLFTHFSHIFDDGSVVTTGTSNLDLLGQSLSNFKKLIEQPFNTDPFNTVLLKIGNAIDTLNNKFTNLINNIQNVTNLNNKSNTKTYRGTKAVDMPNNMNFQAAFNSLVPIKGINYSKTYNASVVQNIYNAPPSYTETRAGRFVKGLIT